MTETFSSICGSRSLGFVTGYVSDTYPYRWPYSYVHLRMESTEKCEAIITHFNGKYIKTPPGVAGEASGTWAGSHWRSGHCPVAQ